MQLYNDKLNSTCLGASQAKGLRASKVTIQGDTDVPREKSNLQNGKQTCYIGKENSFYQCIVLEDFI
jgi:hypothetical protein